RLLAAPRRSGLGQGTIQGDPLVRQCGADAVRCNADGASHVSETMRLDASWEGCVRPAIRASTRCCVTLGIHRRQVLGSYFDSMGMDGITSQYPSCCCTESKKYARLPAASACHPRGGDATRRDSGTAAPAHSS